ncbi:MAG: tRNA (adenosine(37)-N6)-threonylcarbamoyltransferase complex dimerization subunit type 1 TsaB [Chitinophagales bacterium]|nr:tRNA (adenosine(37)-N6)-threonylcarbamoyltransferase complex dimerization subunit type 1 TsaB [Chitinophagales bacterium]
MLTVIDQSVQKAGIRLKDLDAIAISDGPGSYTSLRIGASTAKTICYALNKPLITIDSLVILASGVPNDRLSEGDHIIPMIDARRMEVYAAVYDYNRMPIVEKHAVILDEHTFQPYLGNHKLYLCGNGAEKYYKAFPLHVELLHTSTSSAYMLKPALEKFLKHEYSDAAYFSPDYIKSPNITKSIKKLF